MDAPTDHRFFSSLRQQTRIVYSIARSGRIKHVASGMAIAMLCWLAGVDPMIYLGFACAFILWEILTEIGYRTLPEKDSDVTLAHSLWLLGICVISSCSFIAPALALTQLGHLAYTVLGLIVSLGIIAHVTTTYAPFPWFNLCQVIPNLGIIYLQVYMIHLGEHDPSARFEWILTAIGMAVYTLNLFETRNKTHHTSIELRKAQHEASIRLRELEYFSDHDTLTGLLNRRAFDTRAHALQNRAAQSSRFAVMVVDLDEFKPINDSYSHEAGDAVLREIALRIKQHLGDDDIAARSGGDEFILAINSVGDAEAALKWARQLSEALTKPIAWNGKWLTLSASIGIALSEHATLPINTLLSRADQAMYRAKQSLARRPVLYQHADFKPRPTLQDRISLSRALQNGEFKPYYQPKIDMRDGTIIGFEALTRWERTDGTLCYPGDFLETIEELGLQGDFVSTITEAVLDDVSGWIRAGLDPGQVSINLPEVSLASPTARQDLLNAVGAHPEAMGHIIFEITEDVFIARAGGYIRETIRRLRRKGILIALDDFGTGFASFRHLRELEFDELKIDTSFIASLGEDVASDILVSSLVDIAKGLDVQLIAEGVEHPAQRAALLKMGCVLAQGFLWDPAIPANDVPDRLAHQPYQLLPAGAAAACSKAG